MGTYGTEHAWTAYGIPSVLVVDNGPEFISTHMADSCQLLGIVLEYGPVRTPEFKAGAERHFGTLNSGVFHKLPGTTFSNIFQRGDYDSARRACISLGELEQALTIFVVDIYAEDFQRGLPGIPARRWEHLVTSSFSPRLPSREELLILLGRVAQRSIRHYGISFESIRYNCPDLALLRNGLRKGEKAKIKYHPGDLGRIYVFNPFDEEYIPVPALDQDYANGLSLWKHRVIRHFASQVEDEVDLAALGRAKRKIQEIIDAARTRKRISTRSKVARWEGQPPSQARQEKADAKPGQPQALPAGTVALPPPAPEIEWSDAGQDEGWEIVHALPKSRRDTSEAKKER